MVQLGNNIYVLISRRIPHGNNGKILKTFAISQITHFLFTEVWMAETASLRHFSEHPASNISTEVLP